MHQILNSKQRRQLQELRSEVHNGILLRHQTEQNNAIFSNMDDLEIVMLRKVSQRSRNIV